LYSLENTLAGYLLDELTFCSIEGYNDFLYNICPIDSGLKINVPYWHAAAYNFALKAKGEITIILNGTNENGALDLNSIFSTYQLPYFHADKVNSVKILILLAPGQIKYETCLYKRTVQVLTNELNRKNIRFTCIDDAKQIVDAICPENSQLANECLTVKYLLRSGVDSLNVEKFKICFFVFFYSLFYNLK
jgi:ADP-ribosyl cyclase 1